MARTRGVGSQPWELYSANDQKNLEMNLLQASLVGAQLGSFSVHEAQSREAAEPHWPAKLQACVKMGIMGGGKRPNPLFIWGSSMALRTM